MKKIIIRGLLGISFIMSVLACNKLDIEPTNQASEESVYSSPSLIEKAVVGMYNAAEIGNYGGGRRGYPFGAAYQEQNAVRGEDVVSVAAFYNYTYASTYNASASLNNIYYWLDTYRLINRANLLIEGLSKATSDGVISKDISDRYLGEALFMRAISHFELLKHFSRPYHITTSEHYDYGVPYMTKGSKNLESAEANKDVSRGKVKDTYAKVLKDLDEAEKLLPKKSTVYRASKEAAIAYKTIVKLHMRDWQGVIDEANKLDGEFEIESDPNTVFLDNSNNKESIFSILNSETNNPGVNGALGSMYKGRKLIAISPIIWNDPLWLKEDKRRREPSSGKEVESKDMVFTHKGAKFTNKYKDDKNWSDASPIIRYAEVLLNRAEAKARLGDDTFIDDLNKVRNRSIEDLSKAYKLTQFSTKKERVEAILKEKRIEFIAEGKRWGDIHRLIADDIAPTEGIPAKYANEEPKAEDYNIGIPYVLKETDLEAIPYSDHRFLWPIPEEEVSSNAVLRKEQNKGW